MLKERLFQIRNNKTIIGVLLICCATILSQTAIGFCETSNQPQTKNNPDNISAKENQKAEAVKDNTASVKTAQNPSLPTTPTQPIKPTTPTANDKTITQPETAKKETVPVQTPDTKSAPIVDNSINKAKTPAELKAEKLKAEEAKKQAAEKKKKDDEEKKKIDAAKRKEEMKKKKMEWITKTLDYGIQKDRKEAIGQIITVEEGPDRTALETKLINIIDTETNSEVRNKAVIVAGEIKLKNSVPSIIKALDDSSEDVKISAAYALRQLNDPSAIETLSTRLKEQKLTVNSNLTVAYLRALSTLKAKDLRTWVEEKVKDNTTDDTIRLEFIIFLGDCECVESKDILLALLKDENEDINVRCYAVSAIGKLGLKEAGTDINNIIKEIDTYNFDQKKKYYGLYIYCLSALAKLGDAQAYDKMIDSLKSDNPTVRIKSIKLLKELKDQRSIDILKYKVDYDPNEKVRNEAKEALKELGVTLETDKKDEIYKHQATEEKPKDEKTATHEEE